MKNYCIRNTLVFVFLSKLPVEKKEKKLSVSFELWAFVHVPSFFLFYFWLGSSTTLLNSKVLHSWRETFFHYIERFAISLFVLLLLFTFSCWRRVFYWLNGFDGPFLVSFYIFLWLLYFGLIVNTFLFFSSGGRSEKSPNYRVSRIYISSESGN